MNKYLKKNKKKYPTFRESKFVLHYAMHKLKNRHIYESLQYERKQF